jgi:tetratricopeptide (TPR) repeat protein
MNMLVKVTGFLVGVLVAGLLAVEAKANELAPLRLMSPLSSVSLNSLAVEADSAYANKQFKVAENGFRSILELDEGNRRAMFRLGNIYQQQGSNDKAMQFYRQAAMSAEYSQQLDEFGEKALINIALLASEQMKQALAELEKRKPSAKTSVVAQGLVDDLSDSQALITARVASLQKVSVNRTVQAIQDVLPPEVINGNVKQALKAPPRVTYSRQADPSDDSPEVTYVKGAPTKTPPTRMTKRQTSDTQVVYKRIVQRVPVQSSKL